VLLTKRNGCASEIGTRDERGQLVFPEGRLRYGSYVEKSMEGRENAPGPVMGVVGAMVDTFVASKQQEKERMGAKDGKNGKKRNQRIVVKK
jgi:hypothetical protein